MRVRAVADQMKLVVVLAADGLGDVGQLYPVIVWVVRLMSWINLVTCGLRFFCFIKAEVSRLTCSAVV